MENSDANTIVPPRLDSNSIRSTAPSNATTIIEVKESHPMELQQLQGSHHSSLSSAACRCCSDDKVSLDALTKRYEDVRSQLNDSQRKIEELQKSLEVMFLSLFPCAHFSTMMIFFSPPFAGATQRGSNQVLGGA
jgi:hypothetical protein